MSGWRSASRVRAFAVADALSGWSGGLGDAPDYLESLGYFEEAYVLRCPDRVAQAADWVAEGRVCTLASPLYPGVWVDRLGSLAPPALWCSWARTGAPEWAGPRAPLRVGGVGSRDIPPDLASWCASAGVVGAASGAVWVSGDAIGCDRAFTVAAARAGGAVVHVLPLGLGVLGDGWGVSDCVSYLSVCPPDAPFSAAGAFERNALIYALCDAAVVGHARFGVGGTWGGAMDARRRRLCPLIYSGWDGPLSADARQARDAFVGLGVPLLCDPANLLSAAAFAQRSFVAAGYPSLDLWSESA